MYIFGQGAYSTAALGFRSFVTHTTSNSAWPSRQSRACLISEELSGIACDLVYHHERNSSCYQNRFLELDLQPYTSATNDTFADLIHHFK